MYPNIHIIIPSYTFFAVLGGICVALFLFFRLDKYKFLFSDFLKMFALCLVCGFLGSRIVFIFSRIPWLIFNFSLKALLSTFLGGGFVFYGGLFGVLIGVYIYTKKYDYTTKTIMNMIVPAIPLFHILGRIGCFFAGCCYGFKFPSAISLGIISIDRFPTQLVEALFNLILFFIILRIQKKKPTLDYLRIYLLSYATFRFIIEFTRGDLVRGVFWGISTSQIISLIIIAYYIINAVKVKTQKV